MYHLLFGLPVIRDYKTVVLVDHQRSRVLKANHIYNHVLGFVLYSYFAPHQKEVIQMKQYCKSCFFSFNNDYNNLFRITSDVTCLI